MTIANKVGAVLGFRTLPTTILASLIYLAVLISVLVTDQLPNAPQNQGGINLDEAYADLQHIAAQPHPYNSHANDIVRSYLLRRVRDIAFGKADVHVSNDLQSNGSWASAAYGVYFEGTNILVKVDGTDPSYHNVGGVLFSAHYDSVSTAPGATDDGMGVVTLLQLLTYFVKYKPKRTVVFNINNGEEDWLNGAHAFLKHPWSNITQTFLNLEGAASGGRPLLFRATSSPPVLSFQNNHVPHPHANVLSSDAFARGVIRSGTDYSIYHDGADMQGLDLAFYKGRSKYHTKFDAIPHTVGEKKALWAMMEAAKGSGVALANDSGKMHSRSSHTPVYFDLFGAVLVIFALESMITFNIVFLVVGPIVYVLLTACETAMQHNRRRYLQNGEGPAGATNVWQHLWDRIIHFRWLGGFWRWSKFWVALIITVALQVLLVYGYIRLNTFTVYSAPYVVLISSFTLAYLSMVFVLNLPIPGMKAQVPEQQKQTVLLQNYILSWALLIYTTATASNKGVGGLYFATAWSVVLFLACCIGCAEGIFGAAGTHPVVVVLQHSTPPEERSGQSEEVDENTPLIRRERQDVTILGDEETGAVGWWILQMLIVIPFPLILITHIATMVVGAMTQTLADGNSAVSIYGTIILLSVLMILPLSPFAFKLHNALTYLLLIIFIVSTAFNWLRFPLSPETPLKLYFLQNVTISLSEVRATTSLHGVPDYVQSVVSYLPSAAGKGVECNDSTSKIGLRQCSWASHALPVPTADFKDNSWLNVTSTRIGKASARLSVQGVNTRSCRIYLDNNAATAYNVHGSEQDMQTRYEISDSGASELRLWSRTWDKNFTVDVDLLYEDIQTEGRVACEWNEYESGTVGLDVGGKIPDFEEVLTFLPNWAVATKWTDGLVEVSEGFSI